MNWWASLISSAKSSRVFLLTVLGALGGCTAQRVVLSGLDAFPPDRSAVELEAVPFHPQTALQCGPAALATVLGAAGDETTPEALQDEVFTPGLGGSLQLELVAAARQRGFLPYVPAREPGALFGELAGGRPVLVLQNLRLESWPAWHYAVLVGADAARDQVILRSGGERRLVLPAGRFLRTWDRGGRWAMVLLEPGELPARPDRDAYRTAVLGLEETGRHEAAAKAWGAAARRWPDDAVALFGYATNSHLAGDLPAARSGYERLLARDPEHAAALNNLANVLAGQGCPASARRLATKALATAGDPALAEAVRDTLEQVGPGEDGAGCLSDAPGH